MHCDALRTQPAKRPLILCNFKGNDFKAFAHGPDFNGPGFDVPGFDGS